MKYKLIQQLSASQWYWLWVAYWRLWVVLLRIKLKQQSWLKNKILLAKALPNVTSPKSSSNVTEKEQRYFLQMHEAVRLAARLHVLSAACLPRSIVLADMLQSRGHPANVLLGVAKSGQALSSHAWVEVDGFLVAEPESVEQDFTRV